MDGKRREGGRQGKDQMRSGGNLDACLVPENGEAVPENGEAEAEAEAEGVGVQSCRRSCVCVVETEQCNVRWDAYPPKEWRAIDVLSARQSVLRLRVMTGKLVSNVASVCQCLAALWNWIRWDRPDREVMSMV